MTIYVDANSSLPYIQLLQWSKEKKNNILIIPASVFGETTSFLSNGVFTLFSRKYYAIGTKFLPDLVDKSKDDFNAFLEKKKSSSFNLLEVDAKLPTRFVI